MFIRKIGKRYYEFSNLKDYESARFVWNSSQMHNNELEYWMEKQEIDFSYEEFIE